MRVMILDHAPNCTEKKPCVKCQFDNNLRRLLPPETFRECQYLLHTNSVRINSASYFDEFPVTALFGLSSRVAGKLDNAGLETIGELRVLRESQLLDRGLSKTCIKRLRRLLKARDIPRAF